jgi:hypothetical protein
LLGQDELLDFRKSLKGITSHNQPDLTANDEDAVKSIDTSRGKREKGRVHISSLNNAPLTSGSLRRIHQYCVLIFTSTYRLVAVVRFQSSRSAQSSESSATPADSNPNTFRYSHQALQTSAQHHHHHLLFTKGKLRACKARRYLLS